uniref:Uncharacterized protein n=1 Tax=Lotus japonicus TaxID=34305 RepID=I3T2G1_LOTJA|nr:unknown [Lotus japonicus]
MATRGEGGGGGGSHDR